MASRPAPRPSLGRPPPGFALSLFALLALGCGGGSASAPGPAAPAPGSEPAEGVPPAVATADVPGRLPTAREADAFRRLERYAEGIRGLTFARPVPVRIQSRDVITRFVRDQIDADELEEARILYVALGLLDPDLDVGELLVRVLGEQIVGYYDPEQGLMVVREDVAEGLGTAGWSLGEAEMVIVHELVHALQDQRLGLGAQHEVERTIDGDNAFASLVEGDATLAMVGHEASAQGVPLAALTSQPGLFRRMIEQFGTGAVQGQELGDAPPIVREPLLSRYLDGMLLCATLHGGRGWPAVDEAHASPPLSTEQVLHPERYLAGEPPEEVVLPDLEALTAAGLVVHEEDTLGELELSVYLGLGLDDGRDRSAADGWGGDRLRVYRAPDGSAAVVWFLTFDREPEARQAEVAAERVLDTVAPAARGRHRVRRAGRALLILRNLEAGLHGAVDQAFLRFADALPAPGAALGRPPAASPGAPSGPSDPGAPPVLDAPSTQR
ncbi:MAG: hypothetical protein ACFCGT_06480 [Sandaracinaceae bacterium]